MKARSYWGHLSLKDQIEDKKIMTTHRYRRKATPVRQQSVEDPEAPIFGTVRTRLKNICFGRSIGIGIGIKKAQPHSNIPILFNLMRMRMTMT